MNEWMETLITFGAGLVSGGLTLYFLLPARRQYGKLIRERDEARRAMLDYRQQVDHHFLRTAELVNNMTESYRKVHEHLSEGAHDLCSESGRRLAAQASLDALPGGKQEATTETPEDLEPPLDYAPQAKGMLSEDYGLKHSKESPFEPVDGLEKEETAEAVEPPRDYAAGIKPDTEEEQTGGKTA